MCRERVRPAPFCHRCLTHAKDAPRPGLTFPMTTRTTSRQASEGLSVYQRLDSEAVYEDRGKPSQQQTTAIMRRPVLLAYIDPTPPDVAAARCASLFRLYSDPDTQLLSMADFIDVCLFVCLFVCLLLLFVIVCRQPASPILTSILLRS